MPSNHFPGFRQGDRKEMEHYHTYFRPVVHSFLKLLTFNKEFTLCLEKKTFLTVFPKHSTIENEPKLLRTLIWTAWKLFRDKGDGPIDDPQLPKNDPIPDFPLDKLFESLSKRRRQVMKLFFIEGLSFQEIALLLHLDEQTIRNNISRALKILCKQFAGTAGTTDLVFG